VRCVSSVVVAYYTGIKLTMAAGASGVETVVKLDILRTDDADKLENVEKRAAPRIRGSSVRLAVGSMQCESVICELGFKQKDTEQRRREMPISTVKPDLDSDLQSRRSSKLYESK